jgi:hypothetical protein
MVINTAMTLAMAAACLAAIAITPAAQAQAQRRTVTVKHAPVVNPGDVSESWSARENVIESKQYERLLQTYPAFRQARMQRECGPISDPQLHASCLASFNQAEPYVGSSGAPRHYRSNSGR